MSEFKVTDYREFADDQEPYAEGFFQADYGNFSKFTDEDMARSLRINPTAYLGTQTFHVFESYRGVVLVPDYQLEVL